MPEQRRAVDDALSGYFANNEAAWTAGQIEDYYVFPGLKMRMLDESGRRWTRTVRAGVRPLSRDGARSRHGRRAPSAPRAGGSRAFPLVAHDDAEIIEQSAFLSDAL